MAPSFTFVPEPQTSGVAERFNRTLKEQTIHGRRFGNVVEVRVVVTAVSYTHLLLRRMFAEGAFSQAFVPILGEYKNKRGDQETLLLIDHVTSILALVLFAITAIGVAASPLLVWISAPGFAVDASKFDLTVTLTRITFPYIFFMSLVALAGGILNTCLLYTSRCV